jgi:hypothetical protein
MRGMEGREEREAERGGKGRKSPPPLNLLFQLPSPRLSDSCCVALPLLSPALFLLLPWLLVRF